MAEYIELTDLWSAPFDYIIDTCGSSVAQGFVDRVNEIKPADVRPVVRSHWKKNDNGTYSCERCHSWIPEEQWHYANWCLYCGADMRDIEDKEPVDKFEDWSDELKQTYRELLKKLYFIGGDAE